MSTEITFEVGQKVTWIQCKQTGRGFSLRARTGKVAHVALEELVIESKGRTYFVNKKEARPLGVPNALTEAIQQHLPQSAT